MYSYNDIGYITEVKSYDYTTGELTGTPTTTTFGYDGDRLTSFGGKGVSYNTLGYPISHDGMSYVWTRGKLTRQFCGSKTQGGTLYKDTTFTYNAFGRRIAKSYAYDPNPISNSDYSYTYDTTYDYDNYGRLIHEYCTEQYIGGHSVTRELTYLYDESGIIGVSYSRSGASATSYYFLRNLQGDVVAIYDATGGKVGEYAYDAFGNCTILSGASNDLVKNNPIRYRGYYYDRETGLYYLNARYYNPQWRRFISPDDTAYLDPESVNGLNLYAYCLNDPVNYADPSGNSVIASILIGFAVSSLVGWGLSEMFGSQIAGGIGSISGGATAVSTGMNLCAFGPWGIVAGIALMAVGGLTIAFGANEIVDGATGTNYIQNWFGWSDSVYNGVYTGLNIVSAVGSIAGNIGMRFASNKILNAIVQDPSKINNYKLWQIKTFGKYTSVYTPGTLKRGSHVGQGYTLTHNRNASLGYIQWHPGGGHHGPLAYWKITSSFNKAARFYYLTGLPF